VTNAIANSVSVFAIDAVAGTLTPISTVPTGTNPVALTLDAAGRFAYVPNLGSNNVTTFSVDPNTGSLTHAGLPVDAGSGPVSVVINK
jgi:6-phosphogluconolactonase